MSLLQVEKLNAGYGKRMIINDISMDIEEGQIVGILGPNGSGKSTMIKALCKGIPYEGKVSVCGQDIKNMSEKELAKVCSYVPQRSGLAIDISALEVVVMGFYPYLGMLERPSKTMKDRAYEMLTTLGLANEVESNYMELSEGQKRMCILARSLVADGKLLLMDEPDASLDFAIRNRMMNIIVERAEMQKTGVLLTLHDTDLALGYCQKIYLIKEGRLTDVIVPKEDSISEMEQKLRGIYGNVKLLEYVDDNQTKKLVMVQA